MDVLSSIGSFAVIIVSVIVLGSISSPVPTISFSRIKPKTNKPHRYGLPVTLNFLFVVSY